MTKASLIEKRLEMAAEGDFVTVLYNPKSKKRIDLFYKTVEIFLEYRKSNTPVGLKLPIDSILMFWGMIA